MAGASVSIDLSQLSGLESALAAAHARSLDLYPLMDQIGEAVELFTHENFEAESAPDGTPWAPTIRSREDGGQILRDKGHLDNSITRRATAHEAEVGSNLIYARAHQEGVNQEVTVKAHTREMSVAFGRRLPKALRVSVPSFMRQMNLAARPFLGLGADNEAELVELSGDYVLGELGE